MKYKFDDLMDFEKNWLRAGLEVSPTVFVVSVSILNDVDFKGLSLEQQQMIAYHGDLPHLYDYACSILGEQNE